MFVSVWHLGACRQILRVCALNMLFVLVVNAIVVISNSCVSITVGIPISITIASLVRITVTMCASCVALFVWAVAPSIAWQ